MLKNVWIGWDPRDAEAFAVARHSIRRRSGHIPVHAVVLDDLRRSGLYYRPTSKRNGRLWDDISDAPMSTEFAISRFFVPHLATAFQSSRTGWALFVDADVLCLTDIAELFAFADDRYAVMCVQHPHYVPKEVTKMDDQLQLTYKRKNWSSVVLWQCGHPANERLTVEMINTLPGRDLHRFCWLKDSEIGHLPMSWNFLVGQSDPEIVPDLVHFTTGGPWLEGYENVPYGNEWRTERDIWLHGWHVSEPARAELVSA